MDQFSLQSYHSNPLLLDSTEASEDFRSSTTVEIGSLSLSVSNEQANTQLFQLVIMMLFHRPKAWFMQAHTRAAMGFALKDCHWLHKRDPC